MSAPLEEELDGLVFEITGFFQVNTDAALLLYQNGWFISLATRQQWHVISRSLKDMP